MKYLIVILFLSCIGCTIEKRLHRPGFTIRKNNSQLSSSKSDFSTKRKSGRHQNLTLESEEKQKFDQTITEAKIKVDKKPLQAKNKSKEILITSTIYNDEKKVKKKLSENTIQSVKETKEKIKKKIQR